MTGAGEAKPAKNVTVLTSILGAYDNLRPPAPRAAEDRAADFVCFADRAIPAPPPWRLVPAYEPIPDDPARNSRVAKILSHIVTDTEYSVWHDGNLELIAPPSGMIERWLGNADIGVLRHHYHHFDDQGFDCLYKEAGTCIRRGKPEAEAIRRQAQDYRADGHPPHWGLFVCTFLLRRHSDAVKKLNEAWWHEVVTRSARDQISFPYVLRKSGVRFAVIDGSIFDNALFKYHMHASYETHRDNTGYVDSRRREEARRVRLEVLCHRSRR